MDVAAARAEVIGRLELAGVDWVDDPRDAGPPIVIVGLPVVTGRQTGCVAAAVVNVTAVAPPPGNGDAVAWLLDTVGVLMGALDTFTATPTSWFTGSPGADLPAYVVPFATSITTKET
jgi:hypothetical protein